MPDASEAATATATATAGALRPWRVGMHARAARGGAPVRGMPAVDVVEFVAGCPACGADCGWAEQRDDTRVRITVDCSCPG